MPINAPPDLEVKGNKMDLRKIVSTNATFVAILAVAVLQSAFMMPTAAHAQSVANDLASSQNNSIDGNFTFGSDLNYNSSNSDGTNNAGDGSSSGSGSSWLDALAALGTGFGAYDLFSGHGGGHSSSGGSPSSGSSSNSLSGSSSLADVPGGVFTPPAPPFQSNPQVPSAPAPESSTGIALGTMLAAGLIVGLMKKASAARQA
jgi:hypothetical protein